MLELPEDLHSNDKQNDAHQQLSLCLLPMVKLLSEIYRDALIAVDFEGQSLQAVADAENVSLSAIKSRVSRGRQHLRKLLVACCEIDYSVSGEVEGFYLKSPCECEASSL